MIMMRVSFLLALLYTNHKHIFLFTNFREVFQLCKRYVNNELLKSLSLYIPKTISFISFMTKKQSYLILVYTTSSSRTFLSLDAEIGFKNHVKSVTRAAFPCRWMVETCIQKLFILCMCIGMSFFLCVRRVEYI